MADEFSDFLTEEQMEELKDALDKESLLRKGLHLRITKDEMEAWLYLDPPAPGVEYTKEAVMDYLRQNKVLEGIISSNIGAMIKKKVYGREIKVAAGKPQRDGVNGKYEYFFTPSDLSKAPAVREDGSVDYTSMRALQNVHAGDQIALYHPAVAGENGRTITGRELRAAVSKDLVPLSGKGVIRDNDNPNLYLATMDGKIQILDKKVDIQSVHEVPGDVDMLTGKVEFFGDIIVEGNVSSGVLIRAGRNLTINGTVEGCTLFAGGDILLKRGVQGSGKGKITAKGSVFAEFIEYADVTAERDIQANIVLNSNLKAEGKIMVNGKRGSIIGGNVHGLCGVEAQTLGNDVEVKTSVHCGILPDDFVKLKDLIRRDQELRAELAEIVEEMTALIKQRRKMNSEQAMSRADKTLKQLNEKKDQFFAQLDDIKVDKERLSEVYENGKDASIVIRGKVNRNAIIGIGGEQQMPVDKSTSSMRYTLQRGLIDGSVMAL